MSSISADTSLPPAARLVALLIDTPRVLFTVAVAYAISGPLYWAWTRIKRPRPSA